MGIPLHAFYELTAEEQREALAYGDWFPGSDAGAACNQVRESHSVQSAEFYQPQAA